MGGQIFISYRREESRWSARSLHDRLCRDFDPKQIFMDIDAIGLGEDFVEAIQTTVAKCDVLVAVIGNNWLTSKDGHGNRRLDNPQDFVRMEIGAALERKIRVIPVLVDGALMPQLTDLPEDLKPLVRRNALLITETSFDGDCQRLAAAIRQVLEKVAAEEQDRLAAEQRQRKGQELPEAEQRKRDEQERLRAESPPIVQSSTKQKPSPRVVVLAVLGLILIVGLIWFAIRGITPPTATPTPIPSPTLTHTPIANESSSALPSSKLRRFYWDYKYEPQPGRRVWTQTDQDFWTENYESGLRSGYRVVERNVSVEGVIGDIATKVSGDEKATGVPNGTMQIFIPAESSQWLRFRNLVNGVWEQWNPLGQITYY
jgi:hypothetical protein